MWETGTFWFEISIVSVIFAIGNILFGHFEEQTSKFRRVGKYFIAILFVIIISHFFGRIVAFTILALAFIPVLYIHIVQLPKNGINGWTGEPKEKYYELRGWNKTK